MPNRPTGVFRTMCPMNCHPTLCGMKVEVDDGRLISVKGDPDNPDSRGFLCIRGQASREIIDNPRRLTRPLVRAGRGDTSWRETTWDEALDLIALHMRAAGPRAVGTWSGHGLGANNYGTRVAGHLLRRFANLYGCQSWAGSMICWGLGAWGLGLTGALETSTKEDMSANSALIILWGANVASQPNTARHVAVARKRGARVVTVDIRETEASAQSDETFVIRPGTDSALALAMMHVIIGDRRPAGDDIPNQMPRITEAMLERRLRVMLLLGTNILSSYADAEAVGAALARQDLVVSYDVFFNDTARRYADVVLPATSWLEELGCKSTNTHLYLMPKILEAPGEAKPLSFLLRELARRLGVADFWPWDTEAGPLDSILDHPSTGHATVADLTTEGGIRALNVSHVAHPTRTFATPSGKIEVFSEPAA